jgi:acyl-CoA dehydrogenase
MIERSTERIAFGKYLAEQGSIRQDIALSRVEIDQARSIRAQVASFFFMAVLIQIS